MYFARWRGWASIQPMRRMRFGSLGEGEVVGSWRYTFGLSLVKWLRPEGGAILRFDVRLDVMIADICQTRTTSTVGTRL